MRHGPLRLRSRCNQLLHRDEEVYWLTEGLASQVIRADAGQSFVVLVDLQGNSKVFQNDSLAPCNPLRHQR